MLKISVGLDGVVFHWSWGNTVSSAIIYHLFCFSFFLSFLQSSLVMVRDEKLLLLRECQLSDLIDLDIKIGNIYRQLVSNIVVNPSSSTSLCRYENLVFALWLVSNKESASMQWETSESNLKTLEVYQLISVRVAWLKCVGCAPYSKFLWVEKIVNSATGRLQFSITVHICFDYVRTLCCTWKILDQLMAEFNLTRPSCFSFESNLLATMFSWLWKQCFFNVHGVPPHGNLFFFYLDVEVCYSFSAFSRRWQEIVSVLINHRKTLLFATDNKNKLVLKILDLKFIVPTFSVKLRIVSVIMYESSSSMPTHIAYMSCFILIQVESQVINKL